MKKNWNELVAPLGYEPIENFYLDVQFEKEIKKPAKRPRRNKNENDE